MEPNGRAQQLLKLVVEHFIAEGTPVASKSRQICPALCPGDCSNVMGDLESMGLVRRLIRLRGRSPHRWAYVFLLTSIEL